MEERRVYFSSMLLCQPLFSLAGGRVGGGVGGGEYEKCHYLLLGISQQVFSLSFSQHAILSLLEKSGDNAGLSGKRRRRRRRRRGNREFVTPNKENKEEKLTRL